MKRVMLLILSVIQVLSGTVFAFAETAETASNATADAVSSGGSSAVDFNWTVLIGVSVVISFIIAVVLALRKADKVYGKGFDD